MFQLKAGLQVIGASTMLAGAAPSTPANMVPLEVGVCAHLHGASQAVADQRIQQAKNMGATVIRWDAPWKDVEVAKGVLTIPPTWDYIIRQTAAAHIDNMIILDYGNPNYSSSAKPTNPTDIAAFRNYAVTVVNHFKGQVKYYEIWNEWDGSVGGTTPGTATDFVNLVAAVGPAIKAVDPKAKVIAGAYTPTAMASIFGANSTIITGTNIPDPAHPKFLVDTLHMGILRYIDGLSVHPYAYYRGGHPSPTINVGTTSDYVDFIQRIEMAVRGANGNKAFPIYVTEVGWPTYRLNASYDVSEAQQGQTVRDALLETSKLAPVKSVVLYDLVDDGTSTTDKESHFGIYRYDNTPKDSMSVIKSTIQALPAKRF